MADTRPKVSLPPNAFDLICLALVVVVILYTGVTLWLDYADLPDKIPTHYNFDGKADAYGSPSNVIWLIAIQVGLALLLYIVSQYPHKHNYMVEITEENAARIYGLSVSLLHGLNAIISMLFGYLILNVFWLPEGNTDSLNTTIMISFLMSIVLLSAYFIWQMYKSR